MSLPAAREARYAPQLGPISKKIYLHFDLNRTILMSDSAGGRSMGDTVNYLLAEVCYGSIKDGVWSAVTPFVPRPGEESSADAGLVTYKWHGDQTFPYLSQATAESVPEGFKDISSFNKFQKKERKKLQSSFTNDGHEGSSFRPHFNQVMSALELPEECREAAKRASDEIGGTGLLAEFWKDGKYFLLPSFLEFLLFLQSDGGGLLNNVNIVYRTFGEDIHEVAKELNMFKKGMHPCFPGVQLDERLCLSDPHGVFFRNGEGSDGLALAIGTIDKAPRDCNDAVAFYAEKNPHIVVAAGFSQCSEMIKQQFSEKRHAIALRDYWDWWSAHGESDTSGKLLLIDQSKAETEFHAFIDDHVESDHAHIVDVRIASDGAVVPPQESINEVIFRSEPFPAITDRNYFIDMFVRVTKKASAASAAAL